MELFKILGTIAIDNGKANEALEETGGRAGKLSSALGTAFDKAGHFAVSAGKTIAKGLAVGSVAMGKLIQLSVQSYAEYEQLVGGVETLFKNSSSKVMEYAMNAYKTAGLSANEYMSTVTSFSASLLQSLGGDTEAAAEIADMAILDMSDNANKMGTDMAAIQNAYQGFAKQNYTMLDNLKLGYGGTQAEMKRLLEDATALSGIEYDISSYADVVQAIHVIQENMGITGTTAKEASDTISGSLASMKASWQNLLTGIAGAGNLDSLITSFVGSTKTFVKNITKLMPDLVKGVNGLISGLIPEIPGMLEGILPGLMEGAVSLFEGLALALPDLMGIIIDELPEFARNLASSFERVFPALVRSIGEMFTNLVDNLPEILRSIGRVINSVWTNGIWPAVQGVFKAVFGVELPDWGVIRDTITNWWNTNIKPTLDNVLRFIFGVETPNWENIKLQISLWWNWLIKPKIDNILRFIFGVENPSWENIKGSITNWWNTNIKPNLENLMIAIFGVANPDWETVLLQINLWWNWLIKPKIDNILRFIFGVENPTWDSISQKITTWWNEDIKPSLETILSAMFGVENPTWDSIKTKITTWWNDEFKPNLENVLKATFDLDLSEAQTSLIDFLGEVTTAASELLAAGIGTIREVLDFILTNETTLKIAIGTITTAFAAWSVQAHPVATALTAIVTALMWIKDNGGIGGVAEKGLLALEEATDGNVVGSDLIYNTETGKTAYEEKKEAEYQEALENAETDLDRALAAAEFVDRRPEWQKKFDLGLQNFWNDPWGAAKKSAEAQYNWWQEILGKKPEIELHAKLPSKDATLHEFMEWWTEVDADLVEAAGIEMPPLELPDTGDILENYRIQEERFREWWETARPALESTIAINMPDEDATAEEITAWFESVDPELIKVMGVELPPENATEAEMLSWWQRVRPTLSANVNVNMPNIGSITGGISSNLGVGLLSGVLNSRISGFATGLDFVPRDNFLARLHHGEAVLTRSEADVWRNGGGTGNTARMEALLSQMNGLLQSIAQNTGTDRAVMLDTGAMVGQLAPRMNMQLGTQSRRSARG